MPLGELGQSCVRARLALLIQGGLHWPETVGKHPQETGQVPGHHAALALRAHEHYWLLGERPPWPHVPDGGETSGAILTEDPVGAAVELVVAGPVA